MYRIKCDEYANILEKCFEAKTPLMVYGPAGVGKSEIPRQVFEKVAKKMNRTYREWAHLSKEEKLDAIKNPTKYFIFCDQRIAQMDPTDLRGIPNMTKGDMLECIPLSWIIYFTTPGAAGIIFFDEINLAAPTVAGQAYQIIKDRTISDRVLAEDVYIIAAGNRLTDKAYVHDMPIPLRDRFNEVEIHADKDSWTGWAIKNGVNAHLIAFINWKESNLYTLDKMTNQEEKGSSPRSITRASQLIKNLDIISNDTHKMITISCGYPFATEFQAYTKFYSELNWETIFKNPDSVKKFDFDKKWCVSGGLVEQYTNLVGADIEKKKTDKNIDMEKIEKILQVTDNLGPEMIAIVLKQLMQFNTQYFSDYVCKAKEFTHLAKTFSKYLVPE